MNAQRMKQIEDHLRSALPLQHLEVEDESHLHVGHAGARDGRGHFRVLAVSESFDEKSPLQRHRLIYDALGTLMETDIHALSVRAMTSVEYQSADQQES